MSGGWVMRIGDYGLIGGIGRAAGCLVGRAKTWNDLQTSAVRYDRERTIKSFHETMMEGWLSGHCEKSIYSYPTKSCSPLETSPPLSCPLFSLILAPARLLVWRKPESLHLHVLQRQTAKSRLILQGGCGIFHAHPLPFPWRSPRTLLGVSGSVRLANASLFRL